jgi:hypothetical protein
MDFKPERKATTVPVIKKEIKDDDGNVTHYLCTDGKTYTKEGYDRNFKVKVNVKMKPMGYKGKSLDARVIE